MATYYWNSCHICFNKTSKIGLPTTASTSERTHDVIFISRVNQWKDVSFRAAEFLKVISQKITFYLFLKINP